MDYIALIEAVEAIGYPCAFESFPTPPTIPYTVVAYSYNSDLMADGKNYLAIGNYQLELYTKIRQPPDEAKIEMLLKSLGLPYRKLGFFNQEIGLYQMIYEIQLIGG